MNETTFSRRVHAIVKAIPKGSVLTYGQVAAAAGTPGAARAVGSLMKANLNPDIPCHRVVRSDGKIGEYNRAGGSLTKWKRLQDEGVDMSRLHL
ncbi:MGMT family protein [Patescibacteria group bacterium]|nr:MGMT family protein [Patescibacteria group bacterium]MBP9709769.1 MGMT family protein [Patescibacteria group bacterium]